VCVGVCWCVLVCVGVCWCVWYLSGVEEGVVGQQLSYAQHCQGATADGLVVAALYA
jgi:hypothetical protein